MNQILNISCYKFVALPDAEDLRQPCLDQALARGLKGTILIAEEGINFFLAGPAAEVRAFVDWLRQDPRFSDLMPKESWSAAQPFRKMLVKVKREIIRMNQPTVRPAAGRAASVDAATLARWMGVAPRDIPLVLPVMGAQNLPRGARVRATEMMAARTDSTQSATPASRRMSIIGVMLMSDE